MASEMKTVAIVGAGPAGLVTAATLLRTLRFRVTIFEKTSEIGGLWSPNGLIDPNMSANLCQSTVSFAGLSWQSIGAAAVHPKARHVTQYLNEYYRRYIPDGTVVFDTEVTKVEDLFADTSSGKWKVTTITKRADSIETQESKFDFMVLATGPFAKPQTADDFASGDLLQMSKVPIVHSTKYRSLADINLAKGASLAPGSQIVVVGGSHSGSEIATKIALELSTLAVTQQAPQPELIHISSRRLFALSPLLPTGQEGTAGFEPADFRLYSRSSRPPDQTVSFTYGLFNSQKHDGGVKMMQALSGYDSVLGEEDSQDMQLSAVISESYAQMAAFGLIKPVQGNLLRLEQAPGKSTLTATVKPHSAENITLKNIVGVVHANGFNAAASVSFLDESTRTQLGYDPSCERFPLLLDASYLSQNSRVPQLAVMGFAMQYWGVMEMQARALAEAWVNGNMLPAPEERKSIADYWTALREAIKSHDTASIPPNPFGDYVGLVEQAARELRLERLDGKWSESEGPICPARYVDRNDENQKAAAVEAITKVQELQHSGEASAAFAARAVFYGLLGTWGTRDAETDVEATTSVQDELIFRPRLCADGNLDFEYLVNRPSRQATTHEIYRHEEGTDHISVWSFSAERPLSAPECVEKVTFGGENATSPDSITARKTQVESGEAIADYRFQFTGTRIIRVEVKSGTVTEVWLPAAFKG
ncbi:FAD/NAD(P)-binding domain-containing protein [Massarina eburnea CBS 473.64]|uniref:FAD/NAD(P)-binding domain-containing protein n=1 Tax=Massarina eburnea CBS 473.64 TaxID=1395130 RepID=A0A6A6RVT1_9PLEO|nr:FAD/NAD(P)-binding domain-containing protein [Massarina eburnea CBS 473.64]